MVTVAPSVSPSSTVHLPSATFTTQPEGPPINGDSGVRSGFGGPAHAPIQVAPYLYRSAIWKTRGLGHNHDRRRHPLPGPEAMSKNRADRRERPSSVLSSLVQLAGILR